MRTSHNTKGFTQVPNIIFDNILKSLSLPAQVVYLQIIRQTYGWINSNPKEIADHISISQFKERIGIKSDHTIIKAIRELEKCNLIIVTRKYKCTTKYEPNPEPIGGINLSDLL